MGHCEGGQASLKPRKLLDHYNLPLRNNDMEELISLTGLVAGLAGVAVTFLSRIRISIKSKSVEIKFGHDEDDPEVTISDIGNLSKDEIEEIKSKIKAIEMEAAGGHRNE